GRQADAGRALVWRDPGDARRRVSRPRRSFSAQPRWHGDRAAFPDRGWRRGAVLLFSTGAAHAAGRRALAGGGDVHEPLHDAFWGERYGQITDPFGHRWGIAQHLRDVPREELERAVSEAFGAAD